MDSHGTALHYASVSEFLIRSIHSNKNLSVCYLIFLMSEQLHKLDRENWKKNILKMLDIEENYYKSKYKEPVSDFPSDSNQKFAKEMDAIFR